MLPAMIREINGHQIKFPTVSLLLFPMPARFQIDFRYVPEITDKMQIFT